jgi:hypothetical protein
MDGVNLWGFYAIGFSVRRINSLSPQTKMADAHIILSEAEFALNYLLYNDDMPTLESCRGAGDTLWTQITNNIKKAQDTPDALLGDGYSQLKDALNAFEIILRNQLSSVPVYQVSPKGILSTEKLVNDSEQMFSKQVLVRLSEIAIADIKAAGRCLAFNLPTSSGFHIIRALEAVVVDYIKRRTGKTPQKRDLGAYVEALKQEKASDDVVFVIDQIRRLHRNPLMHPEDVLDPEHSMDLFLLCRSAINATVSDMEAKNLFESPVKQVQAT